MSMAIPEIIAKKKIKRYEPTTDKMFLMLLTIFIKKHFLIILSILTEKKTSSSNLSIVAYQ